MTIKELQSLAKENRSEHEEQVEVVNYLRKHKIEHTSMPNENKYGGVIRGILQSFKVGKPTANKIASMITSKIERTLKAEGKQKGYPDLIIDEPNRHFHGLRIELKRRRKQLKTKLSTAHTKISPEQQDWINRLNAKGYKAVVCYGADEAIDVIEEYMEDM